MYACITSFVIVALAFVICVPSSAADLRSYTTNGLTVSHDAADEGVYYNTPENEAAYNVQIMRSGHQNYFTMFHSEPNKPVGLRCPGDSIKSGTYSGPFNYTMPGNIGFRLYGHPTDKESILYSADGHGLDAWSGTGNPMLVKGPKGDKYFYVFFMAVTDDNRDRDTDDADYRHYLCMARSLDMINWELRTTIKGTPCWKPFGLDVPDEWRRPRPVGDVNGNLIRSVRAAKKPDTQGLIGSICYYNGKYHYFYTDVDTHGLTYLYLSTSSDFTREKAWSVPVKVSEAIKQTGTLIRVAKAYGIDRWVALYNGYRNNGEDTLHGDLMIQYSQNMSLTGKGGLSSIKYFDRYLNGCGLSDKYLGLSSGSGVYAQHYFMTDEYGNLTIPDTEDSVAMHRGGMLTWTDIRSVYGDKVYRAGWDVTR